MQLPLQDTATTQSRPLLALGSSRREKPDGHSSRCRECQKSCWREERCQLGQPPPAAGCHHIGEGNCSCFLMFPDDLTAKNRSNLQANKKFSFFTPVQAVFARPENKDTTATLCHQQPGLVDLADPSTLGKKLCNLAKCSSTKPGWLQQRAEGGWGQSAA